MTTVALTFDDGPYPETTPALLAALGDTPATFFLWGEHAEAHPSLVRAIASARHVTVVAKALRPWLWPDR